MKRIEIALTKKYTARQSATPTTLDMTALPLQKDAVISVIISRPLFVKSSKGAATKRVVSDIKSVPENDEINKFKLETAKKKTVAPITRPLIDDTRIVEVHVSGGISNQIYNFINGAWIAFLTERALLLPELIVRPTVEHKACGKAGRERASLENYLCPWIRCFDADKVILEARRYGLKVINKTAEHALLETKDESEYNTICINNYANEYYVYNAKKHVEEANIKQATKPYRRVLLDQPLFCFMPENYAEFRFRVDLLKAIQPAPRLKDVVDAFETCLRRKHAELQRDLTFGQKEVFISETKQIWCIHNRTESDWRSFPEVYTYTPEDISSAIRNIPIGSLVFIIGEFTTETLERYQKGYPEYHFVSKHSFPELLTRPSVTPWTTLTFEEIAIVERYVALRLDGFVGHNQSTFSILTALEHDSLQKPYFFYGPIKEHNCTPGLLMNPTLPFRALYSTRITTV